MKVTHLALSDCFYRTWKLKSLPQALHDILIYIMMDFSEAFKRRYCQKIAMYSGTAVSILLNNTSSHLRIQFVPC